MDNSFTIYNIVAPNYKSVNKNQMSEYLKTFQKFESFPNLRNKKVQVGKDQEKAQSAKDSHSKNRGGKKPN